MDALKKQRGELEKALNAWQGPANIYNPAMDMEKLPRLLIESIEVEGPIQKEWPPPSHKALFFAGDERQDLAYAGRSSRAFCRGPIAGRSRRRRSRPLSRSSRMR